MTLTNAAWMERLKAVECRDSSYQAAEPALVFERAQGSLIYDAEGREFIDLCAGFGVTALGHNNHVQRAVFQQSVGDDTLIIHGMGDVYPSTAKITLLDYLSAQLPQGFTKGALALGGGQAVEIAVKTAQIATKKAGFISFIDSYHGLDLGILPLTSRKDFKEPFAAWMPQHLVTELPYGSPMDVIESALRQQKEAGHGTAGIIVEPVQGRAGIRLPPQGWLQDLAALCRREGALLILDEIFTGLGRIGTISSSHEVDCDLICLGKALGGGLPLSACFGRAEVMDAWPQNQGEALHTGTFFGHPLSCRLGLETLKTIIDEDLIERSQTFGAQMVEDLRLALADSELVRDVRDKGLMIGIELTEKGLGATLMDRLRSRGVIALASGTYGEGISLTPALTFPSALWQKALITITDSIQDLEMKA